MIKNAFIISCILLIITTTTALAEDPTPTPTLTPMPTLSYSGPSTQTMEFTPDATPSSPFSATSMIELSDTFDAGLWDYDTYKNVDNMAVVWIDLLFQYKVIEIVFGFFLGVVVFKIALMMVAQRADGN